MSSPLHVANQEGRPEDVQGEAIILGSMLIEMDSVADSIARLDVNDFSLETHRIIYKAMLDLHKDGNPVDLHTVTSAMRKLRKLDAIGGPSYLAGLTEGLPRRLNVEHRVKAVKDKAMLRDLMGLGSDLQERAASGEFTASDLAQRATVTLEAIALDGQVKETQTVGQFISEHYADPESIFRDDRKAVGIPSGFHKFDEMVDGLQRGDVYVIAARPGAGKTAWVGNLIDNVARRGKKKVLLFALENRKKSVLKRMLCGRALVSLSKYNKRECNETEKQYLRSALAEFKEAPLFWEDRNHITMSEIRAVAGRIKRLHGLDLIVIDQLSHVGDGDVREKGLRSDEIIGKKMTIAKHMAQDLNVPVVVMNQLRRGEKKGTDNRPSLTDLKESGRIEEVADTVAFLHRPAYYATTEDEKIDLTGKEEFIVAKQRDGPTGICHVKYNAECCLWSDKADDRHLGGKVDY